MTEPELKLMRWQKDLLDAFERGELKMLTSTELEIRRRAAQREAVAHWLDAWRMAFDKNRAGETN